jgi:hypothetical protein
MNEQQEKLLTQMVEKFREKHGRLPHKIVVTPLALVALGFKNSVAPTWNGVLVESRLFEDSEVASKHDRAKVSSLGVFSKEKRGRMILVACDLKVKL